MEAEKSKLIKKYKGKLLEIMRKLEENRMDYDEEDAHLDADRVLCNLLRELGFDEVVEVFEKIPRWYA